MRGYYYFYYFEPSKVRAYDERLKSLLKAGWLELDNAIKGRYRLTPLAMLYVEDVGESTNRMFAAVTYEETLQFVIRVKVENHRGFHRHYTTGERLSPQSTRTK